jgi:hypothetical protein
MLGGMTKTRKRKSKKAAKGLPLEVRRIFAEYGRQGGRIGGAARWKGLTKEERSALARRIAQARWKKTTPPAQKGTASQGRTTPQD